MELTATELDIVEPMSDPTWEPDIDPPLERDLQLLYCFVCEQFSKGRVNSEKM